MKEPVYDQEPAIRRHRIALVIATFAFLVAYSLLSRPAYAIRAGAILVLPAFPIWFSEQLANHEMGGSTGRLTPHAIERLTRWGGWLVYGLLVWIRFRPWLA